MKGAYLLGYIETKDKSLLTSVGIIRKIVFKLCKVIELNIVDEKYSIFKGVGGITYCFFLSQSHFIIHTWPEESKIFFDVFTCNKYLDKEKFIKMLSSEFKGKVKKVERVEYK